jgi:hypothetical protein
MNDQMQLTAKGRVKLELYNEKDEVTFTKEKKNLVVLTANEIVGDVMSDPAKMVRANAVDKGDSLQTPGADGFFVFDLKKAREANGSYEIDKGGTNTVKDLKIPDAGVITELYKVTANGADLVINQDVFIKDADKAELVFKTAPLNQVKVEFRHVKNPYSEIVAGTEVIKVNGEAFAQGITPSDADKTYTIDYRTGIVKFETGKFNVEAKYVFKIKYALGFMGIGGKPAVHPVGKPVEFSNGDKLMKSMANEYAGSRSAIQYPAAVSKGDPEIQVLPTKPAAYVEKQQIFTANGTVDVFNVNNSGKVAGIVSIKVNGTNVTAGATIQNAVDGTIKLASKPPSGASVDIVYQEQVNTDYLNYYLAEGPVVELVSVKHQAFDNTVTAYKIEPGTGGLEVGKGDVWLVNPTQGIVQFNEYPTQGVPVQTPGQLTIEYRINSGSVVQYIADFPKGVPGPMLQEEPNEVLAVKAGVVTYALNHAIAKGSDGNFIVEVKINDTVMTRGSQYSISSDGKQITFTTSPSVSDAIVVKYSWLNETHEIYQVAMFTEQEGGKMFNISGVGPVTKDKNTGMRLTWSVTY